MKTMRRIDVLSGRAFAVALLGAALPARLVAQGTPVQIGVVYTCPEPLRLKVLSCAGAESTSTCDLQGYNHTLAARRGTVPRSQVTAMLQSCHLQTAAEAQADARGAANGAANSGPAQGGANGISANGINVGDSVQVLTGFGWTPAKVVGINGNSYRVVVNGIQLNKDYPSEVRRVGGATAHDHANGQFRLGDRVQVHVDGQWSEGKIMTEMGTDYQVSLPGNRMTWAKAQDLRPSAMTQTAPAAPKSGVPPKPGLTSCAGKIEGRYATTGSALASFTMTFRSGKVTATDVGGNDEIFECWMGGEKIYLHQPAHSNMDMTLDINNDGTLQTPMGEIKKKGN